MLDHMDDAESWDGDDADVWEVSADITFAIRDAMTDIEANAFDFGAWMRLQWLRDQDDYYGHWMAWIRKISALNGEKYYFSPSLFKKCSRLFQLPPKPEKHSDSSSSPLSNFSIGIGIGGGYGGDHHDNRDHGHDTHESTPPPRGRTTMPTSTEGSSH
jgi:hypothetical protein